MPVMDGYETIKQIRLDEKIRNIPAIALTANAMKGDKEEAIKAGFDDYLAKPVDKRELLEKIFYNFNKKSK